MLKANKVFTSASQLPLGQNLRTAIIMQPGYRRGSQMEIKRSMTGGYRLYVVVSGQYMDGSLHDVANFAKAR